MLLRLAFIIYVTDNEQAFGSKDAAPFARAIPQSPGFFYDTSTDFQDSQLETLFNITNTTTVAELQALSSEALIAANSLQVRLSPQKVHAIPHN